MKTTTIELSLKTAATAVTVILLYNAVHYSHRRLQAFSFCNKIIPSYMFLPAKINKHNAYV